MPNLTIALPKDLHDFVKTRQDVNWSEVARKAMREHAQKMQLLDSILAEKGLTETDALELGHRLKKEGLRKLKASGSWRTPTSSSPRSSRKGR
jgi:Arc/MetJ-type ribon-helix-helix transcriptional regulator